MAAMNKNTDKNGVDRMAQRLLAVLAEETAAPEDALYALAEAQRRLALSALQHVGWSWLGAAELVDDLAYLLARRVLAVVREETEELLPLEVLSRAAVM